MSWSGVGSSGGSPDTRTGPMEVCGRPATPILFWTRRRSPSHEGHPPHEMAGYMNKTKENKEKHPSPQRFRHKRDQCIRGERCGTATPSSGPCEADCATQGSERTVHTLGLPATWCRACETQRRALHHLAPSVAFLPDAQGSAEVRFLCWIKAGGRFAPSRRETPPRNAGRGFDEGGRFSAFWLRKVVGIIQNSKICP